MLASCRYACPTRACPNAQRNASASAAPAAVVDWYRDLARRVLLASSEAERAAEATVRLNKVVAVAPGCAVRSLV